MKLLRLAFLLVCLLPVVGCGPSATHFADQLNSPDPVKRLHAVNALRHRTREAKVVVPMLTEALKDQDASIRRDAARALGNFGPKAGEAVPALRELAETDPAASVRRAATQSLGRIDVSARR
ncbi:MAG TPA: HEAT repeat domain-containing protein [Gemmataceae bacterium]|nr:HEAT repeat domain-containing protein [Gemmataceae bacterium]